MYPTKMRKRPTVPWSRWLILLLIAMSQCRATAAAPYAHTQSSSLDESSTATLNGMAAPNGEPTVIWFEWGARGSYGQVTRPANVGSGTDVVRISATISNLTATATYQCRLVASNSAGIRYGSVKLFTTGNRAVSWGYYGGGATNEPVNLTNVVAVSAGGYQCLALRADGTVAQWDGWGQKIIPLEVTNVVRIAGGGDHALVARRDGTVWAWGANNFGQTTVPVGLTNVVDVASGWHHSVALRADGTITVWGRNNYGQTNVPPGLDNIVAVASGTEHVLALRANGTIVTWGRNDENQLVVPPGLTNVVAIAAADHHSLGLRANGSVSMWGDNNGGVRSLIPPGLTGAADAVVGGVNGAALWTDGRLEVWGDGGYGQTAVPLGLTNIVSVSVGQNHFLALADNVTPAAHSQSVVGPANQDLVISLSGSDANDEPMSFRVTSLPEAGELYQYSGGARGFAITSPNTVVSANGGRVIFVPLTNGTGFPYANFAFVANDGYVDSSPAKVTLNIRGAAPFTQSVTDIRPDRATLNGMAVPNGLASIAWFEWGLRGSYAQSNGPVSIGAGNAVTRISAAISNLTAQTTYQCRLVVSNVTGVTHGFPQFFTTGDKAFAWKTPEHDATVAVPVGLSNVVGVALGGSHRVVLWNDGTIRVWGNNDYGQTNAPPGLSNIVAVAAGAYHSLALRSNGTLVGWGHNYSGQTNTTGLSNIIAVACGQNHNLALKVDGTVVAWGYNENGLTTVPADVSTVVSIACGPRHNLAVLADGTLRAWGGYNFGGEINVPPGLDGVVAAAGGYEHTLALRADGTVVAWGDNNYYPTDGPTNVPPGLSNVVSVTAGTAYSLAVCADGSLVAWGRNGLYGPPAYVPTGASNTITVSSRWDDRLALGNVPPQATAQAVYGPANQDLAITLTATDLNTEPLRFRITSLPARGTLHQCETGVRGAPILSPNTIVTDSNARVVFVPESNEFASPYATFTFVASDGTIDSRPATVTINIQNSRAFTQTASSIRPTNATLNGVASPNSFASSAWFEWGERGTYSENTPAQPVGNGAGVVRVSEVITNLIEGRTYQFRLVVSNSFGVNHGARQWFTTGDQYVAWGYASYGENALNPTVSNLVAVASRGSHNLALRNDGTVLAWGAGGPGQSGSYVHYGQSIVPPGLSNVVAISGGRYHSLALREDGTVAAWGAGSNTVNNYPHLGQSVVPPGLSNVIAIAAGSSHSLALRSDGSVVAWGWNNHGETNIPVALSNVVAIAGGNNYSLAIRSDGTVAMWGGYSSDPSLDPELEEVVAIAANQALRKDGTVVYWGDYAAPPPNLSNVVAIADEGAFLKNDGTVVWTFEFNVFPPAGLTNMIAMAKSGSLLLGNAQPQATEQVVFGAANQDLVIGLKGTDANGSALNFRITSPPTNGFLYQYENGMRGSAIITSNTPVSHTGGQVIYVPLTNQFASPYTVFSFVANDGRLDSAPADVTVDVQQSRVFTQPATHLRPTTAQLNGVAVPNSFNSWGWFEWGARGQFDQTTPPVYLGNGFSALRVNTVISNLVSSDGYQCRLVVSNANGLIHGATQIFTTGDILRVWGNNRYGQTASPPNLTNLVAMGGGAYHSLALRNDGTVVAWGAGTNSSGSPNYGQSVVPEGLSNVIAVAAGGYFSLALQDNGILAAWGNGIEGQAAALVMLTNAIGVASGSRHALALQLNGTVIAWGNNQHGQTNVPAGLSNVVAIAAGDNHSLALLANGSVAAWGLDNDGQSSVPLGLRDVVGVSAGTHHSLARLANGDTTGWGDVFDDHDGVVEIPMHVPATVSNSLAVASGDYHCLVLQADGTVAVWGYEHYYYPGATNAPPNLIGVVTVAAGGYHNLALGGVVLPLAISQVVTGAANQDLVIALAAVNVTESPATKVIHSLPALGSLYQFTGGSRGPIIMTPGTDVTDLSGRIIYAPPAHGFGTPFASMAFTVHEGPLVSVPATVTINIQPPSRPTIIGFNVPSAGSPELTFTGYSNTTYSIWASTNLVNWELLGPADEVQPGVFQFTDTSATNWLHRFYKAGTP
jgi:alpha-tubulin suppressor-like RCC1 family protein